MIDGGEFFLLCKRAPKE